MVNVGVVQNTSVGVYLYKILQLKVPRHRNTHINLC